MLRNKIDNFHFEDIKNINHPSIFFTHENYDLFILRLPQIEEEEMIVQSYAFVITDDSYYFYDRDKESFLDLVNSKGFYRLLDTYIDNTLKFLDTYSSQIEGIEDSFYEGKKLKNFNQFGFGLKND